MNFIIYSFIFLLFFASNILCAEKAEGSPHPNTSVTVLLRDSSNGLDPRLPSYHLVTFTSVITELPEGSPLTHSLLGEPVDPTTTEGLLGELGKDIDIMSTNINVDVTLKGGNKAPENLNPSMAQALLLRSAVLGDILDEKIAILARVNPKTHPDLRLLPVPGHQPLHLSSVIDSGLSNAIIPTKLNPLLEDECVLENWEALLKTHVHSFESFEKLYDFLCGKNRVPPATETRFSETQAILLEKGIELASNPHVQERCLETTQACPSHQTAALYSRYGKGETTKHLSILGSSYKIQEWFYAQAMPAMRKFANSNPDEARKESKTLETSLENWEPLIHPDTRTIYDHAAEFPDFLVKFAERNDPNIAKDFDTWRQAFDDMITAKTSP